MSLSVPFQSHGSGRQRRAAGLAVAFLVPGLLAACSTTTRYSPYVEPAVRAPSRSEPAVQAPAEAAASPATALMPLAELPGWDQDDHAKALAAFRVGCAAVRDPALRRVCHDASGAGSGEDAARQFLERHFKAELLPGQGVLTGYFAPVYPASHVRTESFTAPVRPPPPAWAELRLPAPTPQDRRPDLTVARASDSAPGPEPPRPPARTLDLDALAAGAAPASGVTADPVGDLLADSRPPPASTPSPPAADAGAPQDATPPPAADPPTLQTVRLREAERALIDLAPTDDVTVWMRPEDLFFMQIQGSGVLVFPDGERQRAAYAGDNGKPFIGIARSMIRTGILPASGASGDGIRRWLSAHAGPEADEVMHKNPRYVFFRMSGDNGAEPMGAAGIPLPPGRAIAMDSSHHQFGALYWIDAQAPTLTGAASRYQRLAVALDTGGAIRGPIRADLYFGTGPAAGHEAGNVKHTLRLARLIPVDPDTGEAADGAASASGRR